MSNTAQYGGASWRILHFVSIYLVVRLLWSVFVPGGSWPLPPWHYVSMGIDVVLLACVLLIRSQILANATYNDPRRSRANLLFGLGVVAGICLLLIRCTSDAAWWTGHLRSGF